MNRNKIPKFEMLQNNTRPNTGSNKLELHITAQLQQYLILHKRISIRIVILHVLQKVVTDVTSNMSNIR